MHFTSQDIARCRAIAFVQCKWFHAVHLLEDAVQEALIALWLASARFDALIGDLNGFTGQRIKWAVQDYLRRETRSRETGASPVKFVHLDEKVLASKPALSDDQVLAVYAHNLIDTLEPREREVMKRYYWGGETLLEIGQRMGLSESRISTIKSNALQGLAQPRGAIGINIVLATMFIWQPSVKSPELWMFIGLCVVLVLLMCGKRPKV